LRLMSHETHNNTHNTTVHPRHADYDYAASGRLVGTQGDKSVHEKALRRQGDRTRRSPTSSHDGNSSASHEIDQTSPIVPNLRTAAACAGDSRNAR
jgi:hypothetical protein